MTSLTSISNFHATRSPSTPSTEWRNARRDILRVFPSNHLSPPIQRTLLIRVSWHLRGNNLGQCSYHVGCAMVCTNHLFLFSSLPCKQLSFQQTAGGSHHLEGGTIAALSRSNILTFGRQNQASINKPESNTHIVQRMLLELPICKREGRRRIRPTFSCESLSRIALKVKGSDASKP